MKRRAGMEDYKHIFDQDKLQDIVKKEMKPKVEYVFKESEEKMPMIIESTIARIFQAPEIESLLMALAKAEGLTSETTKYTELERSIGNIKVLLKKECEQAGKAFTEVLTEASLEALIAITNEYKK
jgi:hypothetical protein